MSLKKRAAMQQIVRGLGGPTLVARKMGVSRQAVQNWIVGGFSPAITKRVLRAENILGVPRENLVPDLFHGFTRASSKRRTKSQ